MPAVRNTKKDIKPAKPYVKSEEGAKVKVKEDKPKADVGNGTYDRVQMFSDIIRVSCGLAKQLTNREPSLSGPNSRRRSARVPTVSCPEQLRS